MARMLLTVGPDGFKPADEVSEEYIRRRAGNTVLADIKRIRNPQFHRKVFAVLQFALDNQESYPSVEILLEAVKIATGRVTEITTTKGNIYYKTQSVSFGEMGEDEFQDFYVAMLDALHEMTGIPPDILDRGGHAGL